MNEPEEVASRTLRAVIEYDGTRFSGWQRQAGARTVQETLEAALCRMTQEPVIVRAASRTDAGVHARGQVVAFSTTRLQIPLYGFERGLNTLAPKDLAVREVTEAEPGWNPRFTSRGKRYRYTVWNDRLPTALGRSTSWWVRHPLDVERMRRAAERFLGTHDFEAFRSSGCPAKHAVRTMYAASVERGERANIVIEVVGNAFCRNMVRIMVGTLKAAGEGTLPPEALDEILLSRDRARAGMTAPPEGLCLEEVIFDDRLPPRPVPVVTGTDEAE